MQYFIGIVPPDDYRQKVMSFQKSWPSNRTWEVAEPHITVKAQSGLTADMNWVDTMKAVCASFPRFQVALSSPASYGSAVVYLSVQSQGIYELHRRMVHAISPTPEMMKRYFELDLYTPHLTLGQTTWGMSESEVQEMKNEAESFLRPYANFAVEYVRIYQEIEPNKYVPFEDIRLAQFA